MTLPVTGRTDPHRHADRMSYQRAAIEAVLDEALLCHLGLVVDGAPRVLPTLCARVGETLYLHGSTGSGPALAARGGDTPVCVTVTLFDGLVFARAQFNHSANYRSVVLYGTPRLVTDDAEKRAALHAIVDKTAPGRGDDSRPGSPKELAQTAVLALPLTEASLKIRAGGVKDDAEDLDLPYWAGVVPLRTERGGPVPEGGAEVPAYLTDPWHRAVILRGDLVTLEPLGLSHVDELFTALDDPEVHEHIPVPRPVDREAMATIVGNALAQPGRVPHIQRSTRTGEVVGWTSMHSVDPVNRKLAIGYTQISRTWWGTGVNVEAKLLLLRHAFTALGAQRVEWQTDVRNTRSQAAIAALGATREGMLRHNRQRSDGSWRDSVLFSVTAEEWPAVEAHLRGRLDR